MRIGLITAALVATLAVPAMANQCPSGIAALDAHLQEHGSMLSEETADQVKDLRDKAEEAHAAGDHAGAMEAIQQAHKAMGM